jgi:hypothetical protein
LKGARNEGDELLSDGSRHGQNAMGWKDAMANLGFWLFK